MSGALSHIRVLDLSRVLAGPWAGQILADLGAEVIKIERPGSGDAARAYDRSVKGESSHFVWVNRSKESLALDVKHPLAKPVLQRLLFKLQYDVRDTGDPPKDHYARNRPLIGNDKPICVKREAWMAANGSYPSGHSMIGWSWGLVLSELAPDRAGELVVDAGDEFFDAVLDFVPGEVSVEGRGELEGAELGLQFVHGRQDPGGIDLHDVEAGSPECAGSIRDGIGDFGRASCERLGD